MPYYYYGTVGDDVVNGSNFDDVIFGGPVTDPWTGAGRDTLNGFGGNDQLHGGDNSDILIGGTGNDELNGDSGNDEYRFSGSFGQDLIYDYGGSNLINFLDITRSSVSIQYDDRDLFITNTLTGDRVSIDDYSYYKDYFSIKFTDGYYVEGPTNGDDTLTGTYGDDTVDALSGNDTVYGIYGNDTLYGGAGNDSLYGDDDNDRLIGNVGNDALYGGNGTDFAGWGNDGGTAGVTVDLTLGTAIRGAEVDTLFSIEDVGGTQFNDRLLGDAANNYVNAGAGDDQINGRDGNDLLAGGLGNDAMYGGTGSDTVTFEVSGAGVSINLATDTATRGTETDRIYEIEHATGSNFVDTIRGDTTANVLTGLNGNDTILGDAGNDTLIGGLGKDTMTGGKDRDIFDFAKGDSGTGAKADIIKGFDAVGVGAGDIIDLSDVYWGTLTFRGTNALTGINQVHVVNSGAVSLIEVNLSGSNAPEMQIRVEDGSVAAAAWRAADFVL